VAFKILIKQIEHNYQIDDIQNIAPMQKSELKDKLILNIMKGVYN
jgi:DNA/RNA endonuclease G (NUC1)